MVQNPCVKESGISMVSAFCFRLFLSSLFWFGGFIAWILADINNRIYIFESFSGLNSYEITAMFFFVLTILFISNYIIQIGQLQIIYLLEGYWPIPLNFFKAKLIERFRTQLKQKNEIWSFLANKLLENGSLDGIDLEEYIRLDAEIDDYPKNPDLISPTRLGNLIKAFEEYPKLRYGLDINIIWPRFWLVMPENSKCEIGYARQKIDENIAIFCWSSLFSIWSFLSLWFILIALLGVIISYHNLIYSFKRYGKLLCASFDLYRFNIYESLHIAVPSSPRSEFLQGEALTQFLKRGYEHSIYNTPFEQKVTTLKEIK